MASGNNMQAAQATYGGFINLIKWTIPVIALIAVFVVMMIA